MDSPHSQGHHRLSPSFADSAIDVDLTDTNTSKSSLANSREASIAVRLVRIAEFSAEVSRHTFDAGETAVLHECLDGLEAILDPRPRFSREIAKNRPSSSRSTTPVASPTSPIRPLPENAPDNQTVSQTPQALTNLLEELSSVNSELQQRRLEARHIHDLFTYKCEGLAQRVIELEDEMHELRSDILEDTIELEGLRGTVRGLESWIGRWERQRETPTSHSTADLTRKRKSRWRRKGSEDSNHEHDNDFDNLLDGISGWMRGWKDVEEGFRIRARRRKFRRNQRMSQSHEALPR